MSILNTHLSTTLAAISLPWGNVSLWATALWSGLLMLTIALVLLAWTRWGSAKPLSKCVVLSVFAHILLMCYAYGTNLFTDTPPVVEDEPFQLRILASAEQHQSDSEPGLKAWEKTSSDTMVPTQVPLERSDWSPAQVAETAMVTTPDVSQEMIPDEIITPAEEQQATDEQPAMPAPPTPERSVVPAPVDVADAVVQEGDDGTTTAQSSPTQTQQIPEFPTELTDVAAPRARVSDVPEPVVRNNPDMNDNPAIDTVLNNSIAELATTRPPVASATSAADTELVRNLEPVVVRSSEQWRRAAASLPALRRAGDGQTVPDTYRLRMDADRRSWFLRMGGSPESLEAIDAALKWLADNQHSDGRWDADLFGAGRETRVAGHNRHGAGAQADTGLTGLALLTMLASGNTHLDGDYRGQVQKGLEFILRSQSADGSLAGSARLYAAMYCHGMALLAVSEAYAMTGDIRLKPYLERALAYSVHAQHQDGSWRYEPRMPGDMSQFGWQVMAMHSATEAGLNINSTTRVRMNQFLQRCSTGPHRILAGYQPGHAASRPMTAEAMVCRLFLNQQPSNQAMQYVREYLSEDLPDTDEVNLYYWYYGTIAMFQLQGPEWKQWSKQLQKTIVQLQVKDGRHQGSWNPDTVWGSYGGRVYSTAMATLSLEVYLRYLPLLQKQE